MSVGAATSSSVLQRHLILCSVLFLVRPPAWNLGAASVSDAAVHLRRFEALAVSHSLHGKTVYHFFLRGGGGFLPRRLHGRCCTQSTNILALVMRVCVQLLLERGARTPVSLNTVKTKQNTNTGSTC